MHARPIKFPGVHAVLAAFSTLIAVALSAPDAAFADGVVRQVSGTVEIGRGEPPVWTPLAVGTTVHSADRVRTGPDGRVELALESATLRVHENSLLALPPAAAAGEQVELEHGHSLFDVVRRKGRRFEVRTPTVVVSVKGTRFGVEADAKEGVVSVYRGVVGVRAAQASEVVETLVREGFLATGGGERPIELDVVPAGDPWSAWQELRTGGPGRSSSDAPETDLDRARSSLRRATDPDVLKRAAERRPEIADRLRQHAAEAKPAPSDDQDAKDTAGDPTPLPAAPAVLDSIDASGNDGIKGEGPRGEGLHGSGVIRIDDTIRSIDGGGGLDRTEDLGLPVDEPVGLRDSQRDILDQRRTDGSLRAVDTVVDVPTLTGGIPLANGGTALSTDHLSSFDPREVMMLMDALRDLQAASDSLARPWTETDMTNYLEGKLVDDGMPLREAQEIVQGLFR